MTQKYAILGHPIGHSLSPHLQQAAFDEMQLDCSYQAIDTSPQLLPELLTEMRQGKWSGFNVTLPFKRRVLPLLDVLTPSAQSAGAVNTIYKKNNRLVGANTDILAIEDILNSQQLDPSNHCLLIGAGGAARAALVVLINRGHPVTVLNRTASNALFMTSETNCNDRTDVATFAHQNIPALAKSSQLLVNATTIGMYGGPEPNRSPLPQEAFNSEHLVFDMVYSPEVTPMLHYALKAGSRTIGGQNMLVGQGAYSFKLWTGLEAPKLTMERAVREAIGL
tara:strand:+ start:1001 stop:1837 length:837 start_codon:yes stop_codon:yes gene_type:complete